MMWLVLGPYTLLVKLKLLHCGWQEKLWRYLANLVRWIISLYRLVQIIYSNSAYPHYEKHVRFRTERETLFQFLKWFVFTSCRMCSVSHACLERERERESDVQEFLRPDDNRILQTCQDECIFLNGDFIRICSDSLVVMSGFYCWCMLWRRHS